VVEDDGTMGRRDDGRRDDGRRDDVN
jgi:hypothetical protein